MPSSPYLCSGHILVFSGCFFWCLLHTIFGGAAAASQVKGKAPKVVQQDDDSSSDSSEEVATKPVKGKPAPVKAVPKDSDESSEDMEESSEESSSEDEETKKPAVKQTAASVKAPAKEDDSSDESSDENSSDEVAKTSANLAKGAPAKEAAASDDSESEEESEEEEASATQALSAKISNAKGVTVKQLKKFFKSNAIKFKEIKQDDKKSFTVEFQTSGDTQKAVAVSGQEVGGKKISIEAAAVVASAKKPVKRPASGEDSGSEDESEEEEDEEESVTKRKKGADNSPAPKKQKVESSGEVVSLFVNNLTNETEAAAVKKFFTKKGIAVSDVRKNPNKRFAYADLENPDDLDKALALSGSEIAGCTVNIDKAKPFPNKEQKSTPRGDRPQRDSSDDARTLFVKGLAENVNESKLKKFFSEATEIRLPQKDGYHRGFAYVMFADAETAESVLAEKQGAELEGNSLYLDHTGAKSSAKPRGDRSFNDSFGGRGGGGDRRKPQGERGSSTVLFVKNLSYGVDEDTLKDAFPNATTARIAKFQDTGKPRGFGFVEFDSADDCASAYDSMQDKEIDGRQVFLDFSSPSGGGGGGGGRGGGYGGRGGGYGGRGGRGGFNDRGGRGGRGGFGGRGGRGGYGDRGGRGGRGRGGFGGEPQNKKMKFNDSDSD